MSTVLDRHDVPGLPPAPTQPADAADAADRDGGGFVDCRGVLHLWDEED